MVGSKIPVPLLSAGDHVPPPSGDPFRLLKRSKGSVLFSQISAVPSAPALGEVAMVTATVAVASSHK